MLEIKDLHTFYGTIEALKGIDLTVGEDEIVCLIGSNGAGKTSLLKSISNMVKCTGSIRYNGEEILGKKPRDVVSRGIIHVPEGRQVFPGLTVEENLEIGTVAWGGVFGKGPFVKELNMVYELFPRLAERRKQLSWSMSGGEQQMLAIGRGMMARPKLLLLDEPSMGLAPIIIDELFKKIIEINKMGVPLLLVEQNARLALEVSHHAYVLEQGKIVAKGLSEELRHDPAILRAYLGSMAVD